MIELRYKDIQLSKRVWKVIPVRIDFQHSEFSLAREQAQKKCQNTMAASQSGETRLDITKYNKQLMGIIAEIACKKYLERILEKNQLKQWQVLRYDDVRTDNFRSGANEYDLKLTKVSEPGTEFFIESRSSITHDRSLKTGLEQYDIIGPYTSSAKGSEDYNDIYLRPLYEYVDFASSAYNPDDFDDLLRAKKINLYLVAGCLADDMRRRGFKKNMKQGSTRYQALPILCSLDLIEFQNDIVNLLR